MAARPNAEQTLNRLCASLQRLAPHLRAGATALTGGLAVDLHLREVGKRRPVPTQDLDLVAADLAAISPSVTAKFLVSHFHTPTTGHGKFMVQLVDPVSECRVDIFPDVHNSLARLETLNFVETWFGILSAQDLLAHKLSLLEKASPSAPVDGKHLEDAKALCSLLGLNPPEVSAKALGSTTYGSDTSLKCARCEASRSPQFPLAPKCAILKVLGYV